MDGLARHQDFEPMADVTPPILATAVGVENSSRKVLNVVARSRAPVEIDQEIEAILSHLEVIGEPGSRKS